jgi:hypothetical protein
LARRVTLLGVPMRQQAIHQIESGEPPRRITLGEAKALAETLGISLDKLAAPPSEIEHLNSDTERLIISLSTWLDEGQALILDRLRDVSRRYAELEDWPTETSRLRGELASLLRSHPFARAIFDTDEDDDR